MAAGLGLCLAMGSGAALAQEAHAPAPLAPTAALTLDDVLRFAEANAPALRLARAGVDVAGAGRVEADQTFPDNPQVSLGVGPRMATGDAGVQAQLTVQQRLEVAGEQGLRRAVARARLRGATLDAARVRWGVRATARRLWWALAIAAEQEAIARQLVAFNVATREILIKQIKAGAVAPPLRLIADADVALAQEALIDASARRQALIAQLAALIGWPAAEPLRLASPSAPAVRRAPEARALRAMLTATHPQLGALSGAVEARRAEVSLARRQAWPTPTVGLQYSREPGLVDEPTAHAVMLQIMAPIPLWRANQGPRAVARASLRRAQIKRDAEATRLMTEAQRAALLLDASAARVELYSATIMPRLGAHLETLRRAYELGEVDVHQVSQTQRRLLQATARYCRARQEYVERAATLRELIGRDPWAEEVR